MKTKTSFKALMLIAFSMMSIACGGGDGLVSSDSIAPYDVGNGAIDEPAISAEAGAIFTNVTIIGNVDASTVQHKIVIKFQNDSGVVREIRDYWGDDLDAPIGASFVSCDTNGAMCFYDPGDGAEVQFSGMKIEHTQALRKIVLDLVPLGVMFEGQESQLPWTTNTLDGTIVYPEPTTEVIEIEINEEKETNNEN